MRVIVSNTDRDDFVRDRVTLTLAGLTTEELYQVAEKLDELGWVNKEPFDPALADGQDEGDYDIGGEG